MKRMFILVACSALLFACNDEKKDDGKTPEKKETAEAPGKQPAEFADMKYMDIGKKMTDQFASGDIDGWMTGYADKAVFSWSAGDSLAGKEAIAKYWKDRRANVIDSISFTDQIWLPVKVNISQSGNDVPGVWLLSWYTVNAKYKNGKKLRFGVHTVHHFDANDKIDRTVQYIDRAPINAALGMK